MDRFRGRPRLAPPVGARRRPYVHWTVSAGPCRAVALVLHGGKVVSRRRTRGWQLAVLRLVPFADAIARAGGPAGVAVGRVLFAQRGWNREVASPVADLEAVLGDVRQRYGDVPVVLVGHSMGGRAALRAAGDPSVRGAVALAPWVDRGDPVGQLTGRALVVVHGDRDRWTDAQASRAFVERARAVAGEVGYVAVRGDGHGMLRRAALWHDLATAAALRILQITPPDPSAGLVAANTVVAGAVGATPVTV